MYDLGGARRVCYFSLQTVLSLILPRENKCISILNILYL